MERMDLHVHSRYSGDCQLSLRRIVEYAERKGLNAVGIADHCSRHSFGAKMLHQEVALERKRRIEELDKKTDIYLLNCIESDLLSQGNVTFPKGLGKEFFDIVIGSFHTTVTAKEWGQALKRIINNRKIDIFGHPLAYNDVSWNIMEDIAEELFESDIIVELNERHRMFPDYFLDLLRKYGVRFVPTSDAHEQYEIGDIGEGLELARKKNLKLITNPLNLKE